jgi:hypothetical protein
MFHLRNHPWQKDQAQATEVVEEVLSWCEQVSTCNHENENAIKEDSEDEIQLESATDLAMRSVLNNNGLSEEEKCFLYLAIAERGLYKKELTNEHVQFTFKVREDPLDPKKLHCVVERVNVTDEVKKIRKGPGKVQSAVFAIVGPIIGAVFSVILRNCFCSSIPIVN